MRNFVTRLRVWFPPPLILLLFFVTDVLTAIPRFTFDIVNIVLRALLQIVGGDKLIIPFC